MTNNINLTEMVFILDRSGSMQGLESDTIGGFNSLLNRQRNEEGDAIITTVLFDDRYELLHDRIPIAGVENMTTRDYYVRGSTALLDAIGRTIRKVEHAQAHTAESHRPARTVCAIITDGMENSSREYRAQQIRAMIEAQKAKGWEFLFLGANIDAIGAASRIGISAEYAVDYHADSEGTQLNYEVLSETVSCMRKGCAMPINWKERIDEDFRNRRHK